MALSCSLNKSILKKSSCGYSLASVSDVYLANRSDIDSITRNIGAEGECSGEISAITLSADAKWSHIETAKGTSSFTDALTKQDNGSSYRTHSLSFSIAGAYTPSMACVVDALSLGNFVAVVRLVSGNFVMLGSENAGLEATTVSHVGAASSSDFNGLQVEMSCDLGEVALPLSSEAIDALLANIYED